MTDVAAHFRARLAVETDVADAGAALRDGHANFVLLDVRSAAAYAEGHAAGAVSAPHAGIDAAQLETLGGGPFVVYCTGPACNGAQKGALRVAELGYDVREMIGGFEYWEREGFAVERG